VTTEGEDLEPRKTQKGTEVREMKIVFSVFFSDFRGLEKEEEINHGKHGKTQKKGRKMKIFFFRDVQCVRWIRDLVNGK
jgi:hypothetical protein